MRYTDGDPNVIAKSSEEFIRESIKFKVDYKIKKDGNVKYFYYTVQFIESLKILNASLDGLVENSKLGCSNSSKNFPILKKCCPNRYPTIIKERCLSKRKVSVVHRTAAL